LTITTLAKRLKRAREAAGYATATEAARRQGWNENTYRSTENGTRPPGRGAAVEYARAFNVNLDWLLTGRGSMKPGGRQAFRQVPYFHISDIRVKNKTQLRRLLISAEPRGFVTVPDSDEKRAKNATLSIVIEDLSMVDPTGSPQSLYPGDQAVFAVDQEPVPGSIVMVNYGANTLVRRLRVIRGDGEDQVVGLVPLNDDFPSLETTREHVLGVLIGQWRDR
jgi:transcriptional regulator with XRE-family HTH domain